jgi:hypothetical protein
VQHKAVAALAMLRQKPLGPVLQLDPLDQENLKERQRFAGKVLIDRFVAG